MKLKNLSRSILLISLLVFGACSGNSLIDDSGETPTLEVMTTQHLHDDSAAELTPQQTKIIQNDLDFAIELQEAKIYWTTLNLLGAGSDAQCIEGRDTLVALNHAQDFLGEDLLEAMLTSAQVPYSSYCQFQLSFGSATQPALELQGQWTRGNQNGVFAISIDEIILDAEEFQAEENGEVIIHPLHFEGEKLTTMLLFGVEYDMLFEGVDFENDSEAALRDRIHENLHHALHLHGQEHQH